MKREMLAIGILMVLLVLPMVVAVDINIKTLANHKIDITIREAEKTSKLDGFLNQESGEDGNVLVSSSVSVLEVDLIIKLKRDGQEILNEKFSGLSTSGPININMIPGDVGIITVEEIVNQTEEDVEEGSNEVEVEVEVEDEEEVIVEGSGVIEETKNSGKLTGFSIKDTTKSVVSSKVTYFVLGGILLALVVIFVAKKKLKSKKGTYLDFKVKPSFEGNDENKIEDAERKLNEAKAELDEIKNRKGKLEEAKKRFERDKEELERLEKED